MWTAAAWRPGPLTPAPDVADGRLPPAERAQPLIRPMADERLEAEPHGVGCQVLAPQADFASRSRSSSICSVFFIQLIMPNRS